MNDAGGAFDRLLWNGLHPGVFSLSESDVGASLAPQDKETVLLFQLDKSNEPDDPCNELRYAEPDGTRICDGLFFYRRKRRSLPWLVFFELKHGRDFESAFEQLVSGVKLLTKNLHQRWSDPRIHAVIVSGGDAPADKQVLQKNFATEMKALGIAARLGFVTCRHKRVADLRPELDTRKQAWGEPSGVED